MLSEWQHSLVTMAATVVTAIVLGALYWARSIFIPIALAIFLSFVLGPLVLWLQRRGLGRTAAVIFVVAVVLLGSIGIGAIVVQQVSLLADSLPDRAEAIKGKVVAAKTWLVGDGNSRFAQLVDDVAAVIKPPRSPQQTVVVDNGGSDLTTQAGIFLTPVAEFLGQAAFTFILTIFMLLRREDLRNRMIRLLGDGKVTTTTKAVDDASKRISRYLLAQLTINTGFGVVITLALFLLGVKYAILWGFIATLMRYVPYVGTWMGLIPPVLFSVATAPEWGGGWGQPLVVLALFIGLEMICNNIFEPRMYGASMGISEVALLVAAGFWAFLWGPIGLILSGPLTVCLLVLGKHVRRFQFLEVLLGDQPALSAKTAFYQRLAARDQDEAAAVALQVASDQGPDAALETVIVPALCLARRDRDDGDLDPADFQYVVRAAREITEEITQLRESLETYPDNDRVRVLICPARDEAEHVAAEVLAGTLDLSKWDVRVAGDETLASELVEVVDEFRPAAVVLATLPPGGITHCRYLVSRLRVRHPELPVIVGRWGCIEGTTESVDGVKGATGTDLSLGQTRKRLAEMHAVLAALNQKSDPKLLAVGTTGA